MSKAEGPSRSERYAVWLLALMALFLFADQNLMAPNLTQMAQEFGFDAVERDVKLCGHIALVFWTLGGAFETPFVPHRPQGVGWSCWY